MLNWTTWNLLGDGFCQKIFYGFAEERAGWTVVSRRMRSNLGVRFHRRGATADGVAANFVETITSNWCTTFTQLRGSVPVPWGQDSSGRSFDPAIDLHAERKVSRDVSALHLAALEEKYQGSIVIVNLLKKHGHELDLSAHYDHVKDYFHFDLHSTTKGNKWKTLELFCKELVPRLDCSTPNTKQRVFVRSNCKDSIDRTSLFQAFLAREMATKMAQKPDGNLMRLMSENGKELSIQYCGTEAIRSEVLHNGRTSRWGKLRDSYISFLRFYQNAFLDTEKQMVVDVILGQRQRIEAPRFAWLHKCKPQLRGGFVSGFFQAGAIFFLVWTFIVVTRIKKLAGWR